MNWEPIDDTEGYRGLRITAGWQEIAADYEDILDVFGRASVVGFRSARAPRQVIAMRFRRQIIAELARRCGSRLGRKAMREAGADPLGPAEVSDLECAIGQPVRFTLRFRPMPEIALPDLDALLIGDGVPDPRDAISYRLLELVPFTVPDDLVRAELDPERDDTTPGSAGWNATVDRVRLMLILKRIARQEGIEVSEEELNGRIAARAQEFGTSAEALRRELEQGSGTTRLRDMLLAESTLDYLLERQQ
ncbi:trigger factor [Geobacter sp. SVR]|uniref:trigger factor n=1 Tax=Geobacter sp. SVR TaxID=2495594 RepID=UPI00143EFF02|nr:trigger factor [Geobacter sp. SVR]BCS52883.1 hypothetical protein GSVR_11910 [Geobacter sp. SVR]GCF87505.1 hypothetical protein GSbR_41050 [Geobacter sp. SVR]